jgi:tRNA-binding protein
MQEINWTDFQKVELRVGKIVDAKDFPEARKAAYILNVDFGEEIGVRRSSAQITDLYTKAELIGKQVIGVVNFPKKQIGPFMSECLITGFTQEDGSVVLAVPEREAILGSKLG